MIRDEYYWWLYDLVCGDLYSDGISYDRLLRYLYNVEFEWLMPMDKNRAEEGLSLRFRFNQETGREVAFPDAPCSILELMVALAIHCEESIMVDPRIGDRTKQWFWQMISNLGLRTMTDDRWDREYVDDVIDRFLNREYEPDGRGGLFRIRNCPRDVRDMEIWHQLCYFLNTIT